MALGKRSVTVMMITNDEPPQWAARPSLSTQRASPSYEHYLHPDENIVHSFFVLIPAVLSFFTYCGPSATATRPSVWVQGPLSLVFFHSPYPDLFWLSSSLAFFFFGFLYPLSAFSFSPPPPSGDRPAIGVWCMLLLFSA